MNYSLFHIRYLVKIPGNKQMKSLHAPFCVVQNLIGHLVSTDFYDIYDIIGRKTSQNWRRKTLQRYDTLGWVVKYWPINDISCPNCLSYSRFVIRADFYSLPTRVFLRSTVLYLKDFLKRFQISMRVQGSRYKLVMWTDEWNKEWTNLPPEMVPRIFQLQEFQALWRI